MAASPVGTAASAAEAVRTQAEAGALAAVPMPAAGVEAPVGVAVLTVVEAPVQAAVVVAEVLVVAAAITKGH